MGVHLEIRRPSPTTVEFTVTTKPRRHGWTGWTVAVAAVALRLVLAVAAWAALWAWVRAQPWAGQLPGAVPSGLSQTGLDPFDLFDRLAAVAATAPGWLVMPLCGLAAWVSVARVHTSESLLVLRGLGIQTRSTGATYAGELAAAVGLAWWTLTSPWALLQMAVGGGRDGCGSSGGYGGYGSWALGDYGPRAAATTRFIPTAQLQDLLVNEAFRGFEVRYYLVAVVAGGGGEAAGWRCGGGGGGDNDADALAASFQGEGPDHDEEDHVVVVFPRLLPGLDIVRTVWREARACLYEKGSM